MGVIWVYLYIIDMYSNLIRMLLIDYHSNLTGKQTQEAAASMSHNYLKRYLNIPYPRRIRNAPPPSIRWT